MEKHLGTRYELLAEGRESRTFIDPQRAGAAFFDAHRDELPQLVQHDVYSIDGGDPQARHAVIGVTEHDSAGAPAHRLPGMPADVRQGYDAAAQRSPAHAIVVKQEQRQSQDLHSWLAGAPREPVTLALHEHFELHREGHAPQQFGNARQAGAAFYAAPIEQQPRLLHLQPDQEPREVGSTASTVGMLTNLGVYQHPNKVLANDLLVDVDARAGYFSAMEQSVINGLHVTDWTAATDNSRWVVPRLDQRLYGDLQELTMNHRELALQAWLDHAPEDVQRPTFIDLSTGQVATLDKTADMSVARTVQRYVYGQVPVLMPPLDPEAAYLAPPHAAAMVQPPQQGPAMPTQEATAGATTLHVPMSQETQPEPLKGTSVSEQQNPAPKPQQQVSEKQAGEPVRIGSAVMDHFTYSKRSTPAGVRYDVRAYSKDNRLLAEHKSVSLEDLSVPMGQQVVNALSGAKGRTGTIAAAQLEAPGQRPVQAAPAEVVNTIEPAAERVQEQTQDVRAAVQQAAQVAQPTRPAWQDMRFFQHALHDRTEGGRVAREMAGVPEPAAAAVPAPQSAQPLDPRSAKEARQRELLAALYERFDVRGNDFLFKGEAGRVAFTDHGKQLSSKADIPAVVRAMADMAQAKGWEGIRINGTPEFKRSVWLEASLRGIDVQGHTPTAEDRKRLAQAQAQQQAAKEKQGPQQAAAKQPERSGNTMEQADLAQGQGRTGQQASQQPHAAQAAQAAQQARAPAVDVQREQAMNVMRSYLDSQKLDAPTVAEAMKEWGAHIDKAIAQGKAVPTVQVYDPAVARAAAPTQAVVPQTAVHERSAPAR